MKHLTGLSFFVGLFFYFSAINAQLSQASIKACPPCEFTELPAQFCALLVDTDACIQNDLTVQGNLTVCGSITSPGDNYTFAYSTETQTLGVPAPVFTDIYFTDIGAINGWLFTPTGTNFTAANAGTYLIEYDAICRITDSQLTNISIIALKNGVEIAGSQGSIQQPVNNLPIALTRSFIANFSAGDVLTLAFTGGTQFVQLEANSGNSTITTPVGGIRPSVTLTITRVS